MSRAVMVVVTNCSDPAREAEFNDWYNNTHVRDILTVPGFVGATRHRIIASPAPGEGRYLGLWEIEADNPSAAIGDLFRAAPQWRAQGRGFDGPYEHLYIAAYEPITPRMTPKP